MAHATDVKKVATQGHSDQNNGVLRRYKRSEKYTNAHQSWSLDISATFVGERGS